MKPEDYAAGEFNEQDDQEMQQEKPTQLAIVIQNVGLAPQQVNRIQEGYEPFVNVINQLEDVYTKINFDNPSQADKEAAGPLLSQYVHIRNDAKKDGHDKLKGEINEYGKVVDQGQRIINEYCGVREEKLKALRDADAIAEKQRIESLHTKRFLELSAFVDANNYAGLGLIDEDKYQKILEDAKLAKQAREEQERKRLEDEAKAKREAQENAAKVARMQAEMAEAAKIAKANEDALKAKLKAEKEARKKIEREQAAKAEIEAAVERVRQAEERQALLAPDKEKIKAFIKSMDAHMRAVKPALTDATLLAKLNEAECLIANILADLDAT